MNHQAGFEDSSHAYLENKGQNIEQILAINQPAQLYEPGTMTGYSNFSTGLAAYIVERISGPCLDLGARQTAPTSIAVVQSFNIFFISSKISLCIFAFCLKICIS